MCVLARVPSIFALVNRGGMYAVVSGGGVIVMFENLSRSEFAECPTPGPATSHDARCKIQPQIQREGKVLSLGRLRGRRA